MNQLRHDPNIPIIGQTRAWKELRFEFQPIVEPPPPEFPDANPRIVGWQFGFVGIRSDGIACMAPIIIKPEQVPAEASIPTLFKMVQVAAQHFESYRQCECRAGEVCRIHRPMHTGQA